MLRIRRSTTTRLLAALAALFAASAAAAQGGEQGHFAPFNPEFVQWLQHPELFPPGYNPDPLDLPHLAGRSAFPGLRTLDVPPPTYDLRDLGRVTPVGNQGSLGACWAFAAYGSLESVLLPAETWDFSENHMKNTHGFNFVANYGGDRTKSVSYLARWGGPILETDDPYSSATSPTGRPVQKHVQQVYYLSGGEKASADDIKHAIMNHGAVRTTLTFNEASYLRHSPIDGTHAYYNPSDPNRNHVVCLVGWDDNYSSAHFKSTPPGNGAWIMKNSYGATWGDSGYCYVSYYDSECGKYASVYFGEPVTNYNGVYQHDPLGWIQSFGYTSGTAWFANVFTATASDYLCAISFYAPSPDTTYTLRIHLAPNSGPINTGGAVRTQTGTVFTPGYVTIPLDSPVGLTSEAKFSVVVEVTAPGTNSPVAIESPVAGYSSAATASAGQSYVSSNGSAWSDMTTLSAGTNVCLKAFTRPKVALPAFAPAGGTYAAAQSVSITSATPGAAIRYTTDGTDPVRGSTIYTGPVTVDHSLVLKARAWKPDYLASDIKSATYTITGAKLDTTLSVASLSGAVGQTVSLKGTLRRTSDGVALASKTLTFAVNGTAVGTATTNSLGVATKSYKIQEALGMGAKTIAASFAGTTAYEPCSGTGTLTVNKASTTLTVPSVTGTIGKAVTLKATLKRTTDSAGVVGRSITFQLDGVTVGTVNTGSTGTASLSGTIPAGTPPGTHTIKALFAGDACYIASSGTGTLTARAATKIVVPTVSGLRGQTVTLKATLSRITGGTLLASKTLTFKVGSTVVGTASTNASGVASKSYLIPSAAAIGAHTVTVTFAGDSTNAPSTGTGKLYVQSSTSIAVASVSGAIGQTVSLSATLRRTVDNAALSGKTLSFKVGTTSVGTATTNTLGVATKSWKIPSTLGVGAKTITVTFAGDSTYRSSSATGTLTIGKAGTSITVASLSGTTGQTVTLKAALKRSTDGAVLASKTLTFRVNGAMVGTATTGYTGVASRSYLIPASLGKGAKTIGVSFAGDTLYNASSGSGTLTVL